MPMKPTAIRTLAILLALGGLWVAFTQQRKNQASRKNQPLRIENIQDDLHVIFGPGENIGVLVTNEGVILVDDKFDRHAAEILAKVKTVTDQPVRYILNTHHHGDHTGGNQELSASADILMHERTFWTSLSATESNSSSRSRRSLPSNSAKIARTSSNVSSA